MYKTKIKNKIVFWILIFMFSLLFFSSQIYLWILGNFSIPKLLLIVILVMFIIYFITLLLLYVYYWMIRNFITLLLAIINSLFFLFAVYFALFSIIILFCNAKSLKQNQYIEFKLLYSSKEKKKINITSWIILFIFFILFMVPYIPWINQMIWNTKYGFITAFLFVQILVLVVINLFIHITYLILCSKTYKVEKSLRWKVLDLITLSYVWSDRYTIADNSNSNSILLEKK